MPEILWVNANDATKYALGGTTLAGTTTNGRKNPIDTRGFTRLTMIVECVGGTNATVTVDAGPQDGVTAAATAGWAACATRQPGGGAYATAAVTVTAGTKVMLHLDPSDSRPFVAFDITGTLGGPTAVNATLYGER